MNKMKSSGFVETLEHRRITEFCDACSLNELEDEDGLCARFYS